MKRILLIVLALVSGICSAQTFKIQNLDVLGTSTLTGLASFTVRPQFNGQTPWDSGNLTPSSYALLSGATFSGAIVAPQFVINGAAGIFRDIEYRTGGVNRWQVFTDGTAESGANAGSNFGINALSDAGSFLSTPLSITRATGVVAFGASPTAPTPAVGTNNTQIPTTAFIAAGKPCPSIMDYGGNNTNSASNNTALTNAIAASPSGRACVIFPPGKYQFASQFAYTLPTSGASITLMGAGADVTELTWPNASGGIQINYSSPGNSAHFRDMSVTTGVTNGGNGIALVQSSCLNQFAQSDIHRVTFRGADNNAGTGGSDYWTIGYIADGVSGTSVDTVTIYGSFGIGTGGEYIGNGACYSIYHNVSKSTFNSLGTGLIYGSYAQGVTVTQTNIQNTGTGFLVPPSQTGVLSQLQISDSQFATTGNGILIQTAVGNVMLHDNDMFCHVGVSCIDLAANAPQGYSIIGNNISTDGSGSAIGVNIDTPVNASQVGTIVGNAFFGLNVCVNLTATSKGNNVQSNAYAGCTTNVNNLGGAANILGGVNGATN